MGITQPARMHQKEIKHWLPHREPMLLLDSASNFSPQQHIIGHLFLSVDSHWFAGHFPNNPVFPGVLLVECMAQSGALLAAKSWNILPSEHTIVFSSIEKVKFRNPVLPGDNLEIPVQILNKKRNFIQFSGKVFTNEILAASCTFWASSVENHK